MGTNSTVPNNTSPYPDKTNSPSTPTQTNTSTQVNTGAIYQGTFGPASTTATTTNTSLPVSNTTLPNTNTTIGKNCTTPRGQTIADKDFVLAYEQRSDVTTMCNVERRICTNGVLA